jgi:glycosyltransferase involved in cell wall biosynthesis
MKIVHISPTYFSEESVLGGGERFVEELAKAMAPYAQVEIIAFGKTNKVVFLSDNLKLYIFKNWNKSLLNPFNPFYLKRLIKADIIHCHQYLLFITKWAIIFAKIFKKKIFVTDLGMAGPEPVWYFDWCRWIDKFLVISEFSGRFLEKHHAAKEVIYGGVDIEKYKPGLKKENKVLFVGRLLPHKGIDYLIKAIPEDIELDIVGQPYDQKYYKLLRELAVGKRVNFFHDLTDEEIVDKFAAAGVFVCPSIYENDLLGLVFLEAMACGCATIGTRVGGVPEIIMDEKTGFLVSACDMPKLREKIVYFIANPDIAIQMGIAGRRRVEEMFTWDLVAKRCLKAYGVYL